MSEPAISRSPGVDSGRESRPGNWWNLAATFVLLVAGIVVAVLSTGVQSTFTSRRTHTCNGFLPMPISAFVLSWVGAGVGLIVVAVAALLYRDARHRRRRGVPGAWNQFGGALLTLAVAALVFEVFVLYTAYSNAAQIAVLCSG